VHYSEWQYEHVWKHKSWPPLSTLEICTTTACKHQRIYNISTIHVNKQYSATTRLTSTCNILQNFDIIKQTLIYCMRRLTASFARDFSKLRSSSTLALSLINSSWKWRRSSWISAFCFYNINTQNWYTLTETLSTCHKAVTKYLPSGRTAPETVVPSGSRSYSIMTKGATWVYKGHRVETSERKVYKVLMIKSVKLHANLHLVYQENWANDNTYMTMIDISVFTYHPGLLVSTVVLM